MKQLMLALFVCVVGDASGVDPDTWIKVLVPLIVGIISKLMDISQRRWEKRRELEARKELKDIQCELKTINPQEQK